MATLYIDYEGGNDNYGGTSFALKASGTDGALTTLGAFTSATASFPNDGSLIGQYLSIFNGTLYAVYQITAWVSSTALTVAAISGGTALSTQAARQYYIGGRWKTATNGATAVRIVPGDTFRVMASPDATSLGNATWTGSTGRPAAVAISSSTNATPIVITTSAAHGLVTGDYVNIVNHTVNTNANGVWKVGTVGSSTTFQILQMDGTNTTGNGIGGPSGTSTKYNNCLVKLAAPVSQNIALCGGLGQKPRWTASANVTASQNLSTYKEGYSAAQLDIAAAFTTGKAAYYTLPSTLNLSGYQQVSFWLQQAGGTIGAAGACYIALCSDTLGDTVVNTINLPALGALSAWQPVTVDLGSALGSSIQSVAFYVVTDNGAQTFLIDNIIACKASSSADSLNLTSLISKNTTDETWYALQSINYDTASIATLNSYNPIAPRGYYGVNETVTTYKRETIKTTPAAAAGNDTVMRVQESGTSSAAGFTFSGGWNRTDMSTQTGVSWYDGQNGLGVLFSASSTGISYITTDAINGVRYGTVWNLTLSTFAVGNVIGTIYCTASNFGVSTSGAGIVATNIYANNNNSCISIAGTSTITKLFINNGGNGGSSLSGNGTICDTFVTYNGASSGIAINTAVGLTIRSFSSGYCTGYSLAASTGYNIVIGSGSSVGSSSGTFNVSSGQLFVSNFSTGEATEAVVGAYPGAIYISRNDNTNNNSWVYQAYGTVNQQAAVIDSPAASAWKMSPTSANATATTPVKLKLGTIVCGAGTLVTVTARMQRSNTGLTLRLIAPGGQIIGVSTDTYTDMTAAANTWETVTITFTPTNAGGVDIYAYAFGGTTYSGYVCNLTASQA